MMPEPEGKLDTEAVTAEVNGPADVLAEWDAVDWRAAEGDVGRLRQRIFTASKAGDLKRVRNLKKLMLRSRANTLISVRRVTERNAGRLTAGVHGEVVLTPQAKARLADRVHRMTEPFKAMPVRRVYIPKAGSRIKRRPLGIPVIADRCHQARVVNALEPEWEARFEPRSYGFRPGGDLRDELWADDELEALARPRAQHLARRRVAWSDQRGGEDARVDDRARHAAASRSRRIACSSSTARRVASSSVRLARCCVVSSSRSRR